MSRGTGMIDEENKTKFIHTFRHILQKLESRKLVPKFNTKSDDTNL